MMTPEEPMTIPDKPEPPAEVRLTTQDATEFDLGKTTDREHPDVHRYVLAPAGSAVIPPEVMEAYHRGEWQVAGKFTKVAAILRAARGAS